MLEQAPNKDAPVLIAKIYGEAFPTEVTGMVYDHDQVRLTDEDHD
jgi:hypothetical protein